jgi:hypothetical protein
MLDHAGRLELIRSTLAAVSIFAMMSLDVQIETLLAIEKILRRFLLKGRKDVHGGHCLVVWDRVCMPKDFGGLGIPNLLKMNLALWAWWLWLSRVETSRSWKESEIQVSLMVTEIFEATTCSVVGDGSATFFWLDSWLPGGRLKDLASHLFALIKRRLSRARLVKDTFDGGWLDDIPLTSMLLRLSSWWLSQTVWRDSLLLRVWQMRSGGAGVAREPTPRSPATLACSVEK